MVFSSVTSYLDPANWQQPTGVCPVWPDVPEVGGYERVGELHCVGSAFKGLSPGDLVIPSPPSSGVCPVWPDVPEVGGYERVGELHCVGSAFKGLSPGDLVIPSPPSSGTWQTYVLKDQRMWHKIDKDTPVEYAATIP